MAVFYGEFAIILLISGDAQSLARVSQHYGEIERENGLRVNIKSPSATKNAGVLPSLFAGSILHGSSWNRVSDQRPAQRIKYQYRVHGNHDLFSACKRDAALSAEGASGCAGAHQHQRIA